MNEDIHSIAPGDTNLIRMEGDDVCINRVVPYSIFPGVKKKKKAVKGKLVDLMIQIEKTDNPDVEENVENKMSEIFDKLRNNQVILIQGNTGCGKTTKIPRYLLKEYKRIICSQPRKIAAISVAKKVAKDMNIKIGGDVGYAVRFDDVSCKTTRLKYVTDGILLREVNSDRHLKKYDVVIIDEAHERTTNIDILLGYLKSILVSRKDLKVIIMSATMSADKFIAFFECQMIEIRHKVFPLEIFFLKAECKNYFLEMIKTVVQIHRDEGEGDILVFLTGKEEINQGKDILIHELNENEVDVCCIYSTLPPEEQEIVFKTSVKRKIILATNIAETSITIENVKYVVDCGRVKHMRYSSVLGMNVLDVMLVSKAQAKQRAGRAGRTQAGRVFRIYTRDEYENMNEYPVPGILCSNLSSTILLLKSIGVDDIVNFDLIDKPNDSDVKAALELLYYLKTIGSDGRITPMGVKVSKIPVTPELAVSLIASSELGCLDDVSIIAAMLDVDNVWLDIPKRSEVYPMFIGIKESYRDERGDYFSLLQIYRRWEADRFSIPHLKTRFLNVRMMMNVRKIKKQFCSLFNGCGRSDESKVALSFCAGYFMNVAKRTENGYVSIFYDTPCHITHNSSLFKTSSKYILYHGVCRTQRELIRYCITISQEELLRGTNHVFLRRNV